MYFSVILLTAGLYMFIGPAALVVGFIGLIVAACVGSRSKEIDQQFEWHVEQFNSFVKGKFPNVHFKAINAGRKDVSPDDLFIIAPVGLREAEKPEFGTFIEDELSRHVKENGLANLQIKLNDEVIQPLDYAADEQSKKLFYWGFIAFRVLSGFQIKAFRIFDFEIFTF